MVTSVYLVRHAEAEGNQKEFFQGNIDTPLTEKGEQQLEYLAERFRGVHLDAIYFSPFQRTRLTAEAVNRHHGLNMIPEFELREINGGEWEGRSWSDLPSAFPKEYLLWTKDMAHFRAPSGDAMIDVYQRMRAAITAIAAEHAGETVAVFSHGCALRNFLSFAEFGTVNGLPDVGWSDNTAVSLAEYDTDTGAWRLVFKNDSSHLPPELSTLRQSAWNRYETATQKDEA